MASGNLIGYFATPQEGRKALRMLARHGFRRTVLVHKDKDGGVRITDPFLWRRALAVFLLASLFGAIAGLAVRLLWPQSLPVWNNPIFPALVMVGAVSGVLVALLWLRRGRYGVEPKIMRAHTRWLVSGESVLILQAPIDSLQRPVTLLREGSDVPPALFVMHPKRERRTEARSPDVKLTSAQILEHAQRHAREQQVDPHPQRGTELLKRLKLSRQWARQICEDLTAASQLEQNATPAADWILDNDYILEGNARDVLLNLPKRFYQQLPVLASDPYLGMPCIFGLAKDLVAHTELLLERENVMAYI
ncbi:MAG: hypothetical protein Q7U44_01345, partial [Desulfuromonadales bacterium]|nr:hypothetical protein [Desulfuromonadales bacterium]